jgi:hypothetical protein
LAQGGKEASILRKRLAIQDPPIARYLFDNPDSAWIWLLARLYLGWQWLQAGINKVTDPAWINGGTALQGYWTQAVALPAPPARPQITYGWYRNFLLSMLEGGHYTWFADRHCSVFRCLPELQFHAGRYGQYQSSAVHSGGPADSCLEGSRLLGA